MLENSGAGSQGSVGHGKSGVYQGSGQTGSQTNENIYENLPLIGIHGNEDTISPAHPGGNEKSEFYFIDNLSNNHNNLKI